MNKNTITLEDAVMAARYLYYVKATPALSDWEYDGLEHVARMICPKTSKIHEAGSDSASSYSKKQIEIANKMLEYVE